MICFFAANHSLRAHDPDQITYQFWQEEKDGILTIHLTPKGAIDLLRYLTPELQSSAVIQVGQYSSELTQYFNQSIDLNIQGQNIELELLRSDLVNHDAVMEFRLKSFPGSFENYNLQLSSFTEVYRHVTNHITLELSDGAQHCELNAENMSCSSRQTLAAGDLSLANQASLAGYFRLGGMVFLLLGIYFFWREMYYAKS
ncbi:MAG: DUF6702 family protein [Bacteroidota bacterium]